MFRSIKTKILVFQTAFAFAVVLGIGAGAYFIMYRSLKDSQQYNLEYTARHTGREISVSITHKEDLLEKIATSEAVINYSKKQQEDFLIGYFNKYIPEFSSLSYVNSKGTEEVKLVHGKTETNIFDSSLSVLIKKLNENPNKTLNTYLAFCPETNGPCLEIGFLNKSFFDEFVGIILGKVSVDSLTENIRELKIGQSGFAMLLDSQGTILSSGDKNKTSGKIVLEGADAERTIAGIKTVRSGFGRAAISGLDSYFAYAPVLGQNWRVMIIMPYKEFTAGLNTLRDTVLLFSFIIFMAGIAMSMFLAENITEPILKLTEVTGWIAKGDFSKRSSVESKDEIGILAESFNQMAEYLEKTTTSIVNLNREIDERKKAEEKTHHLNLELENSVAKLGEINNELKNLVFMTSHDLREPTRKISIFGLMLEKSLKGKLTKDEEENLGFMIEGAQLMNERARGLLDYTRIIMEPQLPEAVDLNEMVRQIKEFELPVMSDRKQVVIEVPRSLPSVEVGPIHVHQLMQNLIANGIKYQAKGNVPHITITSKPAADGFVRIEITDNGIGIAPECHQSIFAMFKRLHSRNEYEGIGIGLPVCKKIVERYGGKIGVISEPGKGSTFYFTLPQWEKAVNKTKELQAINQYND
jgi:signal transduction histidine kinase